ncbi:ATP-binding cassette domain-containing protein [Acidianus sp. RZ1]|uniref:ATP-binding cassette domain-containing protein n=1 Tax=Acidianus sp. RZ1 TaxID=1540082 RepID=UPI001491D23D|nr:ATP-binding cassette domain-containing protein [Acidianus sp. RZ1]NON62750.1 ABC transporter ATP-binding protein [Acidianus sp. RZ1]
MLEYQCSTTDKLNCFSTVVSSNLGILGQKDSGKEDIIYLALGISSLKKGKVLYDGEDIYSLKEEDLNNIRWKKISAVFYNPYNSLNPLYKVSSNFEEIAISHGLEKNASLEIAVEYLKILGEKKEILEKYPYDLSPLEAKRVSIALAMFTDPEYVMIDDIEYGLNDNGRALIVNSLIDLIESSRSKFVILDNDPSVISRLADEFIVLYMGNIVERGNDLREVYHPYTIDLIREELGINKLGIGCPYSANCRFVTPKCEKVRTTKVGNNEVKCIIYW